VRLFFPALAAVSLLGCSEGNSSDEQDLGAPFSDLAEPNGIAAFVEGEVLVFSRSVTDEQIQGDPRMAARWNWVEQTGPSRDEVGSGQFLNALETCTFVFWPETSSNFDAWLAPTGESPRIAVSEAFYPSSDDMISCMAGNAGQSFAVAVSPKGYDVIDLIMVNSE